jgi:DNA polymerase-4
MPVDNPFLHVDMNAFFASVEQSLRPELKGKPVIVCGDPDGRSVVSAASYEARAFGVRSAMPVSTARRLCPQAHYLPVNGALYASVSSRVLNILERYTPCVEQTSIDEAFLDLSGCEAFGAPEQIARSIKQAIRDELDLTCSVGISFNRLFAKMASDMQKPDGLVVINRQDLPQKIWPLPAGKMVGIGDKTAESLRDIGILTIGQLAKAPVDFMVERFGVYGRAMVTAARGEEDTLATWSAHRTKSLSHETTFERDMDDMAFLRRELLNLCEQVGRRLRKHRMQGRTVSVKYRFPDFGTFTRSVTLDRHVDTTEPIYHACLQLMQDNLPEGKPLRLLGVSVSSIVESSDLRQATLALEPRDMRPVHEALDALKSKFGDGAVVRASAMEKTPGSSTGTRPAGRWSDGERRRRD